MSGADLARRACVRHGLVEVLRRAELRVYTEGELAVRKLADDAGVVLGSLFEQDGSYNDAPRSLGAEFAHDGGRLLLRRYWGGYLAFLADCSSSESVIIRDPSGTLPLYSLMWRGMRLFVSDAELAWDLALVSGEVEATFVAHQLAFGQLRLGRTGVMGVSELLAGQRARCGSGLRLDQAWAPKGSAEHRLSATSAAEAVGSATQQSISALARDSRSVAVRLSGGLDSSIVAVCLGRTSAELTCLNMRTPGGDGDERRYAQAVAEGLGRPLQVVAPRPRAITSHPRGLAFRPGPSALLAGIDEALVAAAKTSDVEAVFTGAGGDNVFVHLNAVTPASDWLAVHGPGPGFWRVASEIAAVGQVTTWGVALRAVRRLVQPRPLWRPDLRFLTPGAVPVQAEIHPWLVGVAGAPPGRLGHVAALLRIQNHVDPALRPEAMPTLHPLLAQPVMEACLAAPTWLWVGGGQDRAVARTAFREQLPELVHRRRGKGRLDSYCGEVYARSRWVLRDLLMTGALARGGYLDLPAVAAYLDKPGTAPDTGFYRLFELADVEIWLRAWASAAARQAVR